MKILRTKAEENYFSAIFLLISVSYYLVHYTFRWSHWNLFYGHGAYGWPEPSGIEFLGVLLASGAGFIIFFLPIIFLVNLFLKSKQLIVLTLISCVLIILAEADNTWYSISKEHIRLVDLEIFFTSDLNDHFGISAADQIKSLIINLIHIGSLVAAYWFIKFIPVSYFKIISRYSAYLLIAIFSTGILSAYIYSDLMFVKKMSHRMFFQLPDIVSAPPTYAQVEEINEIYYANGGDAEIDVLPKPYFEELTSVPEHVLVVAIEGFNPAFADETTMPFYTQFIKRGLSYKNHYSSGNNTLLGVLGLLFGQSPAFYFEQVSEGQKSMFIDQLMDAGYGSKLYGKGLVSYRNIESYLANISEGYFSEEDHNVVIDDILQRTKSNEKTFSFYYYGDTHYPYNHRAEFTKFTPEAPDDYTSDINSFRENKQQIINRYKNTLVEADSYMEKLFAEVDLSNTLVIITGDHGEAMFENDRLSHSSTLNKPMVWTPLVLIYPGVEPGEITRATSHLDVAPTILDLLKIDKLPYYSGVSLLSKDNNGAFIVQNNQNYKPKEATFIYNDLKVALNIENLGKPVMSWLYDTNDISILLPNELSEIKNALTKLRMLLENRGCSLIKNLEYSDDDTELLKLNLRHCP